MSRTRNRVELGLAFAKASRGCWPTRSLRSECRSISREPPWPRTESRAAGPLISFDSPDQVYAAARIEAAIATFLLRRDPPPRVVEIGAGYGGMAYWLIQMTAMEYTIVDLPLVNVIQGYFLARSLGESPQSVVVRRAAPQCFGPADARARRASSRCSSCLWPIRTACLRYRGRSPPLSRVGSRLGRDGIFYSNNQEATVRTHSHRPTECRRRARGACWRVQPASARCLVATPRIRGGDLRTGGMTNAAPARTSQVLPACAPDRDRAVAVRIEPGRRARSRPRRRPRPFPGARAEGSPSG